MARRQPRCGGQHQRPSAAGATGRPDQSRKPQRRPHPPGPDAGGSPAEAQRNRHLPDAHPAGRQHHEALEVMLDTDTKRRIDTARDILVGKVPDPKSQVEQITIALIYKFMDDMDAEAEELGGKRKFFADAFARYGWAKLMRSGLGGFELVNLYGEAIQSMNQ